jgi:hypothetical protein
MNKVTAKKAKMMPQSNIDKFMKMFLLSVN